MSTPSPEILIERRLRAAEIALETARRRRFETDEVVRALQTEVADVEAALTVAIVAREADREEAEAMVRAAERAQRTAEQQWIAERRHRLALERQISAMAEEKTRRDDLARQLAAEGRIRQLEGEMETVFRRAAEFEYGVRMAAFDALKLVRELADRVTSVLPGVRPGEPEKDSVPETSSAAAGPGSEPADRVDATRLDAALDRLRASIPPGDDAA